MDPSDIASRYSQEESLSYLDSIFEGVSEWGESKMEQVRAAMSQLPVTEADFIDLYYFKRWRQTDIANVFGVKQPTVHYRLRRAAKRIRYVLEMPEYDPEQLRLYLEERLQDELNVAILLGVLETTCQTTVASRLGVTQGKVRHRFFASLERIDREEYRQLFAYVAAHFTILKELRHDIAHSGCYVA